jgi:hypothetical protein
VLSKGRKGTESNVHIITDFQPSLKAVHVLRGQGIDRPEHVSPGIVKVAEDVLDEAHALLAPAAMYTVLGVDEFRPDRVTLAGGAVFEGALVARALAGASQVALAVCTIGPALEKRMEELFAAGDSLQAIALDGAGTAAVGQVSQMVVSRVRSEASERGLQRGMRASPGQEGWPIWQQRVLFGLVAAGEIGVRLTDSCLMMPQKSVSFVIGMGPEMRPDAVTCDFCSKRERCRWRVR